MSNDNKTKMDRAFEFLGDTIQEARDRRYIEAYNEGRMKQKERDLKSITRMLLELDVQEKDVYILMNKYFHIDSIEKVADYLRDEKVGITMKKFKDYCKDIGMSDQQYIEYARINNVREKLLEDETLLYKKPDFIKKKIDSSK